MSQFLIFKRYNTSKESAETIALLEKHRIPTEYEEEIIRMDKMLLIITLIYGTSLRLIPPTSPEQMPC